MDDEVGRERHLSLRDDLADFLEQPASFARIVPGPVGQVEVAAAVVDVRSLHGLRR
jgi:hypothetical protein